jgi:Family of unknown function (DUF5706)
MSQPNDSGPPPERLDKNEEDLADPSLTRSEGTKSDSYASSRERERSGGIAGTRTAEQAIATFSSDTHEYLSGQIEFGEQKAAFVFAADTAFLGYLFSLGVVEPLFMAHRWSAQTYFGVSSIVLLLISVAIAVAAVLPRLAANPSGLIYFGNIASRTKETYVRDVVGSSPEALVKAVLEHCHERATIARSKHLKVRFSALFAIPGFLSGMAYAVLAGRHAHFV